MEELKQCPCGSEIFYQVQPGQIRNNDFFAWGASAIRFDSITSNVAKCLVCGRLTLPEASFAGRNRLDSEVQLYGLAMNAVEKHNSVQDSIFASSMREPQKDKLIEDLREDIYKLNKQLKELEDRLFSEPTTMAAPDENPEPPQEEVKDENPEPPVEEKPKTTTKKKAPAKKTTATKRKTSGKSTGTRSKKTTGSDS